MSEIVEPDDGGGVRLRIKAVPGARRNQIVGPLGDRLKVRVAAPPEGGKANRAICSLLGDALGIKPRAIRVIAGHANPQKTVCVQGIAPDEARRRLGL